MKFPKDNEDRGIMVFLIVMYGIIFSVLAVLFSIIFFLNSSVKLVQ